MQIDLGQIPPEKSRLFLDHLRVRLPYFGSLSIGVDEAAGVTEESCSLNLDLGGEQPVQIDFTVRWKEDGRLLSLEAESDARQDWREEIHGFVHQAFIDTLAADVPKHVCNEVFGYIGSRITGEYRLGSRRLICLTPAEPRLRIPVEHAVLLTFPVYAPDGPRANSLGWLRANDFMAVLGCILGIGFYRFRYERLWTKSGDDAYQRRPHTFTPDFVPEVMPEKPHPDGRGKFTPRDTTRAEVPSYMIGGDSVAVWSDTRALLRVFADLGLTERERFLGAARLYQIALTAGRSTSTVRIAYQISAVDSLLKTSSSVALAEFVEELVPTADRRVVLEAYQKIRSGHFHSGD